MDKVSPSHIVWGIAIILILLVVGYVFYDFGEDAVVERKQRATNTPETGESDNVSVDIVTSEETVTLSDVPIPDLDREIAFSDTIPLDVQGILRANIIELTGSLKEDPSLFGDWVRLGVQRKIAGDYIGARDAWEYAGALALENSISFSNLGDLYHYYLKDYQKADENLLTSIDNNRQNASAYLSLHELYKLSYEEKSDQADDVLLQGLGVLPQNVDLLTVLGYYYLDQNDAENARTYLTRAKEEAEKAGDTERAALLGAELERL